VYFLIETFDAEGADELRGTTRPAHLRYLSENASLLLAAGAKLDDEGTRAHGSMYVLDVPDRAAAEAFLAAEPFICAGVIRSWTITRWRKGFFDYRRVPEKGRRAP
jgi:uncharacterized protein